MLLMTQNHSRIYYPTTVSGNFVSCCGFSYLKQYYNLFTLLVSTHQSDERLSSHSSSSQGGQASAMVKMMKEATKHHGDVQAKLDASAPFYFFLTSIADSSETHQEPLTITFTGMLFSIHY